MTTTLTILVPCTACGEKLQATGTCHLCGGRAFTHVMDVLARNERRVWACRAARCAGGHVTGEPAGGAS